MLEEIINEMAKEKIKLNIEGKAIEQVGASRFGGKPDVPEDFKWPYYYGTGFKGEEKNRPLSFMCQINCSEASQFDSLGLLPNKGVLSFFYEEDSSVWGYSQSHRGSARVYCFEDVSVLRPADYPEDLESEWINPVIGITMQMERSYPSVQDIQLKHIFSEEEYEEYEEYQEKYVNEEGKIHQLLGWPFIIQNNMTTQCELINRGYELGGHWDDVKEEDRKEAEKYSLDDWILLLQLDEVETDDFYLSFGDSGLLYFYIKKGDLLNRKFDNIWLVYQCY